MGYEGRARPSATWDAYKSAVRKVDRNSLLAQCAAITTTMANGALGDEWMMKGVTEWDIADIARTALAWSRFQGQKADLETLLRLCALSSRLIDESLSNERDPTDLLGKVLPRIYFEQLPKQRSVMDQITRSLLLFEPNEGEPDPSATRVIKPRWFEDMTNGLSLAEYLESVFFISVMAMQNHGRFSLTWLEDPQVKILEEAIPFEAVRKTFSEQLVTTPNEFKEANRIFQDSVQAARKKFSFNPLADKPFIDGIGESPTAPWVQAIISKASAPSIYYMAMKKFGRDFSDDLGTVFQNYVGRQLYEIPGLRRVIPEVRYGAKRSVRDSCDWFLDLPDLLVLIECKSRQPVEALRTGGDDWLNGIEDSVGKGIDQLNESNRQLEQISVKEPRIDASKPRVGLIVTLEPFYLDANWLIRERLNQAELPTAVISVGDLEALVTLSTDELSAELRDAARAATNHVMFVNRALDAAQGRENQLLVSTWEKIALFKRVAKVADQLRTEASTVSRIT